MFWWSLQFFINCHYQQKLTGTWDIKRAIPGARPYISCLGRSTCANNIWGSKWFNPQKKIWTEETSNKFLLCDHRWPLGHVVLKIVKRQKPIPVLSTHTLTIWFVLAQWILQIQSNSWFTCAQFLAGGLWWFGNGFRLHESCVQHRMRKHPWYRLTLSLCLSCFHSQQCQQFHHVSPMDIPTSYAIGPLHWASPVQPRGLAHQQAHHFCFILLSCEIQRRLAWEPQLTFEVTLSNITSLDRRVDCRIWRVETMCGKRCFSFLIWLTRMSKTWMNSKHL